MIKVGIHENVELVKAEKNDKGTLVISLKKGGGLSLAERLSSGSDESSAQEEADFIIWPITMGEYVQTGQKVAEEFEALSRMLKHILKGFITEDQIQKGFNPFNGIELEGKTDIEITEMLTTETVLAKMYSNIADQFIELISPFIGKAMLFRVRLNRQSAKKAFSSFPKVGKFANLDRDAFWESMDVKAEASSVQYSNYELGFRKGDSIPDGKPSGTDLSNPDQVTTATAASAEETKAAEEMFGGAEA